MVQQLVELGIDVDAIRAEIIAAVRERPMKRMKVRALARQLIPEHLPEWAAWSTVALSGDLINPADDARFGYFGGRRYRVAPEANVDPKEAFCAGVTAYLAAFGPASRADLAQWSGHVSCRRHGCRDVGRTTPRPSRSDPDAPRPDHRQRSR